MVKQLSKIHPENLKDVNAVKIDGEVEEFVTQLHSQIEEEESKRVKWKEKAERLQKLRFGIRKRKTHPWPNCANFSIPLIDSAINRIKSAYVNLAFNVTPIVTFVPFGAEDVEPMRKRELLFDWRMRTKVKFFSPYSYGVDQILGANGMTLFRVIWNFSSRTYEVKMDIAELPDDVQEIVYDARIDDKMLFDIIQQELRVDLAYEENVDEINRAVQTFRDGKTELVMTFYETVDNQPEVIACDVRDDAVIPFGTKDVQDARFIDYKFTKSINDIKISINDGKFQRYDDGDIQSWADKTFDDKGGASSGVNDIVLLHETCCWKDINNDGIEERCIATWPDADPASVLRFIEVPYDHGLFPYVLVKRELIGDGTYDTRGLSYLLEDFQKGISTAVNQAVDNGTITNTPVTIARRNTVSNPKNLRFVPGNHIETSGPTTDFEIRSVGNNTQGVLFQQAQYFKGWSDDRLGQMTSGLGSQTDLPGLGERGKKTKAEIDTIVAMQSQTQSLDLMVFQQQMARVYEQIDALYYQYGDEEEEILITGQQPVKVSRHEVQGKFNIVPNGRLDNSTPGMRLQKLMMAFQIGMESPMVKQDELLREIYKDIDPRYAQKFLKTPEELQQEQQQMMAMQEQAKNQAKQEAIEAKVIGDDLDVRKEALLEPITGRKYAPE